MKVAYSHAWLKSVQAEKDIADLRGEIIFIKKLPANDMIYCRVKWKTGEEYGILAKNLVQVTDKILDPTE